MQREEALFFSQITLHGLPISFFDIEFMEILDIFSDINESPDKIR